MQGEKGEKGDVGARGTVLVPNPTISWRRLDNSPLPKLRASLVLTNALKIIDIQAEDAGSCVCEAKNVFGLE